MTALLLEVAIRAALVALGTALVLRLLRIQGAAIRHAAWTAVVIVMLGLPIWLAGGVRVSLRVLEPARAPVASTPPVQHGAVPGPPEPTQLTSTSPTSSFSATEGAGLSAAFDWRSALLSLYLAGAVILFVRLFVGTVQASRLRARARVRDGRLTSSDCTTPITVGWLNPVLILPDGWQQWPAAKLDAVLTHERAHARRRDPLVQWLALLNRSVFCFHPLAWWLERRLATLSEEACDAAVLSAGHSPQEYSEYLLDMARAVTRSHGRVHFVGMAMPGSGLSQRLRQIFQGLPLTRVSRARAICTVAFCAMSSALFSAGILAERVPQEPQAATPSAPRMDIKFEIVSIKPCLSSEPATGRGSSGRRSSFSPGYAYLACASLAELVQNAWGGFFPVNDLLNTLHRPPGNRPDLPKRVRGGPDWVEDDRWDIEIRLSGDSTALTGSARVDQVREAMRPALRAMLADRFQLKLRKATEQMPMYALTVASGGLRIQQTATATEKCWQIPPDTPRGAEPVPPPGSEGMPPCRFGFHRRMNRGNHVWELSYISLSDLAKQLSETVDRYVLDKTGVEGRYSFTLEYAPDDRTPGDTYSPFARRAAAAGVPPPAGAGPSIFNALEALGLKLEPTRGPSEYLQIDSVQRPRPDGPGSQP